MQSSNQKSFESYLPLWIVFCFIIGIIFSKYWPDLTVWLEKLQVTKFKISLPIAILIFLMTLSLAFHVDVKRINRLVEQPAGLYLSASMTVLLKPFTLYILSSLFFYIVVSRWVDPEVSSDYMLGIILMGSSSTTAFIQWWTKKIQGDETYTLGLILFNVCLMLILFTPLTKLFILLTNRIFVDQLFDGKGRLKASSMDLYLSLGLYVLIPILLAIGLRFLLMKWMGDQPFEQKVLPRLQKLNQVSLLLTLICIFTIQGQSLLERPIDSLKLLLVLGPILLTDIMVFFLSFLAVKSKLSFPLGGPTVLVSTSHFYEFILGCGLMIGGMDSAILLVPILALFIEVPLFSILVKILNRLQSFFKQSDSS